MLTRAHDVKKSLSDNFQSHQPPSRALAFPRARFVGGVRAPQLPHPTPRSARPRLVEQNGQLQQKMMGSRQPILSAHKVVMMSITGLVVLLAVGPQSVQGRTVTYANYVCTIRDSDNELVFCTGSGSTL